MRPFPRILLPAAPLIVAALLLLLLWPGGCAPIVPVQAPVISATSIWEATGAPATPVVAQETPAPLPVNLVPSPTAYATETLLPTPSPTATPTATEDPRVVVAVIGDFGLAGSAEAQVAALVDSWEPNLIITTGDNNYPDGEAATIDENIGQYFHEYISPYQGSYGQGASENRFFPTIGNHDWTTPGAQPYLDYFQLPGNERYYDFVWGPLHFFAVSSDSREPDGVSRISKQAQWLQAGLAASRSPWQIVYMHQPPYSSGLHGPVDWMRWPFGEWGADAVLAGHDHDYERLDVGGTPYFVNGLGGGPIYYFNEPLPESQIRYADDHGAMRIEADSQGIKFEFYNVQGVLVDQLKLARSSGQ